MSYVWKVTTAVTAVCRAIGRLHETVIKRGVYLTTDLELLHMKVIQGVHVIASDFDRCLFLLL